MITCQPKRGTNKIFRVPSRHVRLSHIVHMREEAAVCRISSPWPALDLVPEFRQRFWLVEFGSSGRIRCCMKKLYVGNLPFSTDDNSLRGLFEPHGQVTSASIVMDRDTGRSRGFGFVEMSDDGEALRAVEAMNGQQVDGRSIVVNEARPKEPRAFGGGGGGGGGRGGYGGGGGGGRGGYGGGGGGGGRGGDRGDRGDRGGRSSGW